MAEAATIARPYAKAAFAFARDAGRLAAWSQALGLAAGIAVESRVAALLSSPKLSPEQIVGFFDGLGGGGVDVHWSNFVRQLVVNKRLEVLPQIASQYEALRREFENQVDVQVTAATALDAAQQVKLAAALKQRLRRDVRLTTAMDPSLLGGAVIRAGDLVIDGSLKGRLQRLASELGG